MTIFQSLVDKFKPQFQKVSENIETRRKRKKDRTVRPRDTPSTGINIPKTSTSYNQSQNNPRLYSDSLNVPGQTNFAIEQPVLEQQQPILANKPNRPNIPEADLAEKIENSSASTPDLKKIMFNRAFKRAKQQIEDRLLSPKYVLDYPDLLKPALAGLSRQRWEKIKKDKIIDKVPNRHNIYDLVYLVRNDPKFAELSSKFPKYEYFYRLSQKYQSIDSNKKNLPKQLCEGYRANSASHFQISRDNGFFRSNVKEWTLELLEDRTFAEFQTIEDGVTGFRISYVLPLEVMSPENTS